MVKSLTQFLCQNMQQRCCLMSPSNGNSAMELRDRPASNSNSLTTIYTNAYARSIVNKLEQFQSLVYSKSPNIIAVTETRLNEYIFDDKIFPCNYTLFCKDHSSCGGGVLIAMSNKFPCQVTTLPENLEIIIMYQTNVVQSYVLLLLLLYMLLMYLPALLLSIMIVNSTFSYICIMFHTK